MRLRYVLLVCLLAGCGSAEPRAASGPRLYLAGDGEYWVVDVAGERVRHVVTSQLKPGDQPHRVLTRSGRVILGTPYGDSAFFLPSAHRDRVWVVDVRNSDGSVRAVREVTVDGETTVAAVRTPGDEWPIGAVDDGLLFASRGGVVLWRPSTQRLVRRLPVNPSLMGPTSTDTVSSCADARCKWLWLVSVATGEGRTVRAPAGFTFEPWNAAFAPDGDMLAVTVYETGAPAISRRRLALVDVATGRVAVVRGSAVAPGYNLVAWSGSGRHVFLSGGQRFARRSIVGYRLGTMRAQTLDVEAGDFYDLAAT